MIAERIKKVLLERMDPQQRMRWLVMLVIILVFTAILYPGLVVTDRLPGIFTGFVGVLGTSGAAWMKMSVPNDPRFGGVTVHIAGITANPFAPGGVHLVSNLLSTTIGR